MALFGRQPGKGVVGSTKFERAAALEVFAFEEHAYAGLIVETGGGEYGRAARQRADPLRRGAHIISLNCQTHPYESSSASGLGQRILYVTQARVHFLLGMLAQKARECFTDSAARRYVPDAEVYFRALALLALEADNA